MDKSTKISLSEIEKIKEELIRESFPTLKEIQIKIIEKDKGEFSAVAKKKGKNYITLINLTYLKIYDEFEVKGLLSHELSHVEEWVREGGWFYFKNKIKCSFSDRNNSFHEREIDKIAICKGYRKELKAQRKKRESYPDKNYYKNKKSYFSSKEIDKVKCK